LSAALYDRCFHSATQGDWTPPVVPALWGRIPDGEWQNHEPYNPPHDKCKVFIFHVIGNIFTVLQGGDYHGQDVVSQPNNYDQHPDQQVEVPQQEQKKNWWDLDDDRKKQLQVRISSPIPPQAHIALQIGGGLLAGAAVLAGGYAAWHAHENNQKSKSEEEVSFTAYIFQTLPYTPRRNKPLPGICKGGCVMLKHVPKSSASTVPAPPRPGYSLRDARTFRARL
jgi:hypothetical protein